MSIELVEAILARQYKKTADQLLARAQLERQRWRETTIDDAEAQALKASADMLSTVAEIYLTMRAELLGLTPTPAPDTRHAMTFDDIKSHANMLRTKIKDIGADVKTLKGNATETLTDPGVDKGEVIANVQIAYRLLEDARMRLGKAIQAIDGGKSIYDTPPAQSHEPQARPLEHGL